MLATNADCSSLTSIDIPNSVTKIERSAFASCSNLTSVIIPTSMTSIANYAFDNCTSLTSVICETETPPTCGKNGVFDGVPTESATLYVPEGSIDVYSTTNPWSLFGTIKPIGDDEDKINSVKCDSDAGSDTPVYNLNGQRITTPRSGLYIKNGKIVLAR